MLNRKVLPRLLPRALDRRAVNHGIRARKVDKLKHTLRGRRFNAAVQAADTVAADHNDLSRLDIAHKLRAQRVKRARFRGKQHRIPKLAHTKRAHPARVARRNQLPRGHDNQRIGTTNDLHRAQYGFLNGRRVDALTHDGINQHFGIRRRAENPAVQLDFPAQLHRVYQIAVMRDREIPLDMGDGKRLRVLP